METMEWKAKWVAPETETGDAAPVFSTNFSLSNKVRRAVLHITALGVYEARINN